MGVFDYQNKAILSLGMRIGDHDGTNLRTLDSSPSGIHTSFGAGAAAPAKISGQRGYTLNGAQYFTGATLGRFNQERFTFSCLVSPLFVPSDALPYVILDTQDPRYTILKSGDTSIYVYLGGTNVLVIGLAVYSPYFKLNQYNTLVVSGTSGSNFAWLNGVQIGTSATAWNASNPANYWIASRANGLQNWYGRMYQAEAYPINFTQIQAYDWHREAMKRLNDV